MELKLKEGPTLPHEREFIEIISMALKAYEDPNYIGVFVCDVMSHVQHILGQLTNATEWDVPNVKIFREGIEVEGGGKVIGMSLNTPDRLRGMSVSEIVIFGTIGEFFYNAQASLSKTQGEMRFVA